MEIDLTSKFLTVIPARAGSKGVPGKNTMAIAGATLVERALAHSRRYSHLGPVILTTDIPSLLLEESLEGVTIPPINSITEGREAFIHHRAPKNASSEALIVETLRYLTEAMSRDFEFEAILLLQPTSPFRSESDANQILSRLPSINEDSSIVSFANVGDKHPARMYQRQGPAFENVEGFEEFSQSRRQDLPPVFVRDGAFYVIGTNLVKEGSQFSRNPEGFVREAPWTTNIDSEDDLVVALAASARITGDDK